jgi:hypothetical protein
VLKDAHVLWVQEVEKVKSLNDQVREVWNAKTMLDTWIWSILMLGF